MWYDTSRYLQQTQTKRLIMDFDYKKYSMQKLEEWMHDAISCSEASPQEIYDVIKGVVDENYQCFKNQTERCYELLALLNGNGVGHISAYDDYLHSSGDTPYYFYGDDASFGYNTDPGGNVVDFCNNDDPSPYCKGSWVDFWENDEVKEDKVVKWQLPVQRRIEDGVDDYFVQFPDDLLEAANLKGGDTVEWVDQGDGSYLLRKVNAK
jgi:hypothetical protein